MEEKTKDIAARLREMRDISSISETAMAQRLGIPLDTYQRYETGQEDIPASVLHEAAQILGIDMGVLLTGEAPRMHIFTVTRHGKGAGVERTQAYAYQDLASNFIHAKMEPFLVTVEPSSEEGPLETNSHPGQEFDYVIEGRLRVLIHDNLIELEPGDSIFFDSSHEHAMQALDGKPARFLAIIV